MSLATISEEQRKIIQEDIGYDDAQMKNKIQHVKEWMSKQPHLPKIPDEFATKMAQSFLLGTKMSTERVKYKIDAYYSIKHHMPDVLQKRDPTSKIVTDSLDLCVHFPLSQLTPEGYGVYLTAYLKGPEGQLITGRHVLGLCRRIVSVSDARVLQGERNRGAYIVQDMQGGHISHVAELPWPLILKFLTFCQECLPFRIKAVLIVNAPPFFEKGFRIIRPVLSEKMRERVHVLQHYTDLYKYIPRRLLPAEYGGDGPTLQESNRAWQKTTESLRDFILEDEQRVCNESNRPKDTINKKSQIYGLNGTFNRLNID